MIGAIKNDEIRHAYAAPSVQALVIGEMSSQTFGGEYRAVSRYFTSETIDKDQTRIGVLQERIPGVDLIRLTQRRETKKVM